MPLKTTLWDPAEYLTTPGRILGYLEAALEEGEPALIAAVLGDIALAKGIPGAAAGLTSDPPLSTVLSVLKALGIGLRPIGA